MVRVAYEQAMNMQEEQVSRETHITGEAQVFGEELDMDDANFQEEEMEEQEGGMGMSM